jgi:hypothetical protein
MFDSVMPGDSLHINTNLWGSSNKGIYTIASVGNAGAGPFLNQYTFTVIIPPTGITPVTVSPGVLGTQSSLVQIIEKTPGRFIKQIQSISPNPLNGTFSDIKFNTSAAFGRISEAAGSIITALDKLDFNTSIVQGIDGYNHDVGLIGAASQVIYGDPTNPTIYPGIVADGATVLISGPLVKRIVVSLVLRIQSGFAISDIANRVKSAVAGVINKTGVGQPIALSSLVAIASKVGGVISVTIAYPMYNPGNDLIPIQPYEKPLVLNLDTDISVSFAGQ